MHFKADYNAINKKMMLKIVELNYVHKRNLEKTMKLKNLKRFTINIDDETLFLNVLICDCKFFGAL